jgi:hypothetical protein
MQMSNKLYDSLNATVKIVLPAVGTLYFTIASVWHLPYGEQVVGSIAGITTFLGVVLSVAKKAWATNMDGSLVVDKSNPDKDVFSLEVNKTFEELAKSKNISLKVVKSDQ